MGIWARALLKLLTTDTKKNFVPHVMKIVRLVVLCILLWANRQLLTWLLRNAVVFPLTIPWGLNTHLRIYDLAVIMHHCLAVAWIRYIQLCLWD